MHMHIHTHAHTHCIPTNRQRTHYITHDVTLHGLGSERAWRCITDGAGFWLRSGDSWSIRRCTDSRRLASGPLVCTPCRHSRKSVSGSARAARNLSPTTATPMNYFECLPRYRFGVTLMTAGSHQTKAAAAASLTVLPNDRTKCGGRRTGGTAGDGRATRATEGHRVGVTDMRTITGHRYWE